MCIFTGERVTEACVCVSTKKIMICTKGACLHHLIFQIAQGRGCAIAIEQNVSCVETRLVSCTNVLIVRLSPVFPLFVLSMTRLQVAIRDVYIGTDV